jgi:hypothetical protein
LVVSSKRYGDGREGAVSPLDLALIWGPLTQEPYLSKIRYSQSGRWYHYRWGSDVDTDAGFIARHSANTHIVILPDQEDLKKQLFSLKKGDAVRLSGYLVKITASDGWYWNSSRSRQDTGAGACELMVVTAATIL